MDGSLIESRLWWRSATCAGPSMSCRTAGECELLAMSRANFVCDLKHAVRNPSPDPAANGEWNQQDILFALLRSQASQAIGTHDSE
jgi:hypothetical protein